MTQAPSRVGSERSVKRNPRDGWERFANHGPLVAVYRRFPTTVTLLAPYLFLILPPAFAFGNPQVWFLIEVALIALAGTFLPDLAWPRRKRLEVQTGAEGSARGLFPVAFFAISTSSVVGIAAAYLGKGSVAAQIGVTETSVGLIGTLDSLIRGWAIVGVGLLFAAYICNQISRKSFLVTLSIPVASAVGSAYFTQITAPVFGLITFVAMMALFLGVLKLRVAIIGMISILVIWPTVFEFRNELRMQEGVRVSESVSAMDRVRFDLLFARGQELDVPLDIEVPGVLVHPSLADMLRYGLVPRFLDPEREIVSTGRVINVALGGNSSSSYTFGPVTTAYVLEGPVYLFLYYFLLSVYVNVLWRRGTKITPTRLALLALVFSGPLGWFSTFPDTTIGMLQNMVSALPLLLALSLVRKAEKPSAKV